MSIYEKDIHFCFKPTTKKLPKLWSTKMLLRVIKKQANIIFSTIIIIIWLQSRRLQIFSKNSNLKLARQLHLNVNRFLNPLGASGCMICSLSFVALVSFCHELEHRECISCMVRHLASWGCAQRNEVGAVLQRWWQGRSQPLNPGWAR